MAASTQTLCNQVLTNVDITGNGVFTLFAGTTVNNSVGLPCARLVLDYASIVPEDTGNNPISYSISPVLEGLQDQVWFPLAYQFEPYKGAGWNGHQRIVVLQPGISTFDAGVDDSVWVGDTTIARISRQQGRACQSMRLKVVCKESGFGTAGAFQQVHLTALLELFDEGN